MANLLLCAAALLAAVAQDIEIIGDGMGPQHRRPSRHYRLPRSGVVTIAQLPESDSVGASQWDAGYCLAEYIEGSSVDAVRCDAARCDVSSRYANATAIALGAGAGGLDVIALLNSGATVLATDGDASVLDQLASNVRANQKAGAFLGATRLRWADGGDADRAAAALAGALDLIVAADVSFHTADTRALVDALDALSRLPGRTPEIVLAHTFRFRRDDARFLAALDDRFARTELPKGPACSDDAALFRLAPRCK
ncbi:hypothetical protein JL721_3820 [Aureococcus anophagefferens]|nr:hypothetical protein JL721_3820 [Aureococcus anophagefferens]